MSRSFLLFCVSGTLAFGIDAGIVQLWVGVLQADPYVGRLISVLFAVSFTWAFNRRLSFAGRSGAGSRLSEFGRYLLSQSAGFAVNYALYSLLIYSLASARSWPVLAVAAGSLAGLSVNYFSARRWVFRAG